MERPPVSANPLLELGSIGKSSRRVRALDGVNLSVDREEVLSLLGEDGAGKRR